MIHQNKIGFNDTQIYMTGDSAGGELYVACGLTDNKHQIQHLFPMYAAIDITINEAEFDYYLQSNKYFAQKLRQAGKNVEEVFYKGMDHGFLDRSGSCNQSEDLLQLIASEINNN